MSSSHLPSTSDYKVGKVIGEGAFAKIFFGLHKTTRSPVAIKVVSKLRLTKHPGVLQGLIREQTLLKQWKESNHVVELLASFHDDEFLYLVLECASRGTLSDVMLSLERDQAGSPGCGREVWHSTVVPSYVLQLVEALEFIHSHRVIHLDLKPDNVLIMATGRLKVTDLASALALDQPGQTQQTTIGTTDFSGPEIWQGTQPTFAADLWSLGCICFGLLMDGYSPFHDDSDMLAIKRIQSYMTSNRSLDFLAEVSSKAWNNLIVGLLNRDPASRLGMSDVVQEQQLVSRYESIRSHPAFTTSATAGRKGSCEYLPPHPAWWEASQADALRDGSGGWPVFL